MAKQQSEEEKSIKSRARRRLIGAVALALVVVVILPMVLDSEPKITGQDIDLRIPAPDKVGEFVPGVALSKVVDEAAKAESAVGASPVSGVAPAAVVPDGRPANHAVAVGKMEVKQAEVKPAEIEKVEVKKAEVKKTESTVPVQKYVVQVGAFSKAATATQEANKLKALGFKAYTELVDGTTRVRLGPYADRNKADEMRKSLEKHDLHPVVKEDDGSVRQAQDRQGK